MRSRVDTEGGQLISLQNPGHYRHGRLRFDQKTAIAYAKALSQYNLFWYEEPGDPLDYGLQSELAKHYAGAMATGENLFSVQDARNLIRYGAMRPDRDWLQFDCAES
jgi:D(-)-tartrate dehydratase